SGELIQWRHRDNPSAQLELRQVLFIEQVNDAEATVQFGIRGDDAAPRLFRAPLAELVRPQPVRPIFEPPPPPYIPGPPVAPKLKPLRTGLRDVIAKRDEAKAGVADKAELVQRAEAALAQSNRILAEVVATEQRRAEALEHSIRNGSASAPVQDNDAIVV